MTRIYLLFVSSLCCWMQIVASCNVQNVFQFIFIYLVAHITILFFKNCLLASSPLLKYCNKSFFTSDAGLSDDNHISFSLACSCMSKGFWQFKNPICNCWTSFSLFLSLRGLQNDIFKSPADHKHISIYYTATLFFILVKILQCIVLTSLSNTRTNMWQQ